MTHPTVKDLVLGNFLSLVFLGELELESASEMFSREVLEAPSVLLVVTVVAPELSDPIDSVFRWLGGLGSIISTRSLSISAGDKYRAAVTDKSSRYLVWLIHVLLS